MSNLEKHADRELKLAGLHKPDADYGGAMYETVMDLVKVFSKQGHSGFSAQMTLDLFNKVAKFESLAPIGKSKDEWVDISKEFGKPMWQNERNCALFSTDKGKTWYDVNDPKKILS